MKTNIYIDIWQPSKPSSSFIGSIPLVSFKYVLLDSLCIRGKTLGKMQSWKMGGPDTGEKHYCADHKRLPGGSEMSGNLRKEFYLKSKYNTWKILISWVELDCPLLMWIFLSFAAWPKLGQERAKWIFLTFAAWSKGGEKFLLDLQSRRSTSGILGKQ